MKAATRRQKNYQGERYTRPVRLPFRDCNILLPSPGRYISAVEYTSPPDMNAQKPPPPTLSPMITVLPRDGAHRAKKSLLAESADYKV